MSENDFERAIPGAEETRSGPARWAVSLAPSAVPRFDARGRCLCSISARFSVSCHSGAIYFYTTRQPNFLQDRCDCVIPTQTHTATFRLLVRQEQTATITAGKVGSRYRRERLIFLLKNKNYFTKKICENYFKKKICEITKIWAGDF